MTPIMMQIRTPFFTFAAIMGLCNAANARTRENVTSGEKPFGTVPTNVTPDMVCACLAFDAFFYLAGIVLFCMSIVYMKKRHEENCSSVNSKFITLYLTHLGASILCFAVPTFMRASLATPFSSG